MKRTKKQEYSLRARLKDATQLRRMSARWLPAGWRRAGDHSADPEPVGPFHVEISDEAGLLVLTSREFADRHDAMEDALQQLHAKHPMKPGAKPGNRNGAGNKGKTRAARLAAIAAQFT